MKDEYVVVGHIKRAVGLKGEVLIKVYSQPESITEPSCIFLKDSQKNLFKRLVIERFRLKGERDVICLLSGIHDRNEAEGLSRKKVFQRVDLLPGLDHNEFYWYELKGMNVFDENGNFLGKIEKILETGSNDCLIVRNGEGEILIPMVEGFIEEVNKREKKCRVNLPEGLIEATFTPLKKKR